MPGPIQSMLATAALLISSLPLHAQGNSTSRPSTGSSVTTGIGTGSSFKNVPPNDRPPPESSRPAFWDTPEAHEKPPPEDEAKGTSKEARENGKAAAAPPAAEDPRTMITRDRIESPQH